MRKMNIATKIFYSLLLTVLLSGCVDSGGSDKQSQQTTLTDTKIVFSTFPQTYFDSGYSESYALSGSYSNGQQVTATWNIKASGTATFNAQTVKVISNLISLTNTTTSAVVNDFVDQYFSSDKNNLMFLGRYGTLDGVTASATSINIVPLTGSIGDFGLVGSYSMSDGKSLSVTWALNDGGNGKAKFAITTTQKDAASVLEATSVQSWTINQDGTRTAADIKVTLHQLSNLTLTMSGTRK